MYFGFLFFPTGYCSNWSFHAMKIVLLPHLNKVVLDYLDPTDINQKIMFLAMSVLNNNRVQKIE